MSTPTEAYYDLRRHVIFSDPDDGAELIADSEANAVAAAVTALTCIHHNDLERAACPVCLVTALTAERDKLRAQNDQFSDNLSAVGAVYNAEKARAERAEAELATERAIVSRIWTQLGSATYEQLRGRSIYDLIDELKANATSSAPRWKREREWQAGIIAHAKLHYAERKEAIARAERAEADLATERARLDHFLRWDPTFNSREDIDAAMQEAAK